MKTVFTAPILFAVLTLPLTTVASSTWKGSGIEYSPAGNEIGHYQMTVVNTDTGPNTSESKATVQTEDGSQKIFSQVITTEGTSWQVVSDFGKGRGSCYGADLCENYIQGKNGLAIATTIVQDDELNRRNITFILVNGKAVKILKDKLLKVQ